MNDRREALETIVRAFTNTQGMERHVRNSLWQGPIYKPEHTRITVAGGRVVAAVVMAPRMIRFGPVKAPAMTIGPVATHDSYRKRGYAEAAMKNASSYMKENGVLLAYLGGIPDFYYRFGYYPFVASGNVKFNRKDTAKESRKGRIRAMTRKDLPRVRKLYNKVSTGRICAAARDEKVWEWLLGPGTRTWLFSKPKVILDARGRLCGYLTMNSGADLNIHEIVVMPDEASCRAALGAIAALAKRREAKEITLPLPWDDALAVFLRQYVGAGFKMSTNPTGGPLMKIVDFPALMSRLQPLFALRCKAARRALTGVRFTLKSEVGAVGFTITRGGVRVGDPVRGPRVRIPKRWLSGMLTGYYSVAEIAPRHGAAVPSRARPAMEILFPPGWPLVYRADSY